MDNKYNWDNKNTRKSNKTYLCFKDKQYGKILSCHENYYYLLFNIIFKQLVMRMLRKLFLPVILFGTILVSSFGFVSCSDDYDDSVVTANVSALQTKLSALEAIQAALPTADEIAAAKAEATAAVDAAKADATAGADAAKAEAIQAAVDADAAQISIINTSIDSLATVLHTAIDSKVGIDEVNVAIDAALVTINAKIDSLNVLKVELESMMTQISIQNTDIIWYYGAPVAADVTFGPTNDQITYTSGEEINKLSMDIIATVNPSNVDMSLYTFSIINSEMDELPVINLGTPVKYTGLYTKAAATSNNLWEFPTTMDWDEVSTPGDLYSQMVSDGKLVGFSLAATPEEGREMNTTYDLTFKRTAVAASVLTLTADPTISGFNSDVIFTLKKGGTSIIGSTTPIYKKYITLTDPITYDVADFTGLDNLMDNDDIITVQCTNDANKDKLINFTVHYLNYDGTTNSVSTDVMFAKLVYNDVTIDLNSVIDFGNVITAQKSDMELVTDFSTEVGAFADYVTDNDIQVITTEGSTINNTVTALPYDAANPAILSFLKDDGTTIAFTSVGNSLPAPTAITNDLKKIMLDYSANSNFVDAVGNYGVKLTFVNSIGNPVNYLYLVLKVTAPADPTVKLTATWNSPAFTEANVWAEVTGANATYDMNNSYMNIPTSFTYNETDNAMSFAGDVLSIPNYSTIAARPSYNYSVTSTYNEFIGGVISSDWTIPYTFDIHMKSAVNEATPAFAVPTAANASLIYKNTLDNTKEVLNISSILATDPSDISQTIEYTPTILDPRIASIKYTIVDENSVAGSSNAGLALFSTGAGYTSTITVTSATVDLIKIVSAFHATPALAPAAVTTDVTLNLQMEITDVFGFEKTVTLPFTVKKNQN